MARSMPIMAPTNPLMTSRSDNCPRFSRKPSRIGSCGTTAVRTFIGSADGAAIGTGFQVRGITCG